MKMFITTIGYRDYAVPVEDASQLLLLLNRPQEVGQTDYSKPYHFVEDSRPIMDRLMLADVGRAPAAQPDPGEMDGDHASALASVYGPED